MRKKQIKYGLTGVAIGAVLGMLVGLGELNWIKKSQRTTVAPFVIVATIIVCAASGYGIGSGMGKTLYIEERIGQDKATDNFYKNGKFWHATTKWTDRRDNNHDCESATKETIPKYHTRAKQYVFQKLKQHFREEPVDDMFAFLKS